MEWFEFLQFGFIQRALIAGSFIAILCAILGVFLVLRRLSLIGDGLAHATFGSVALSLVLNMSPLILAVPVVMVCALGILRLTERVRLYGDAAIGIVSAAGIALGVLLASLAGGFNVDLFSYLFGSILSIGSAEVVTSILLAFIVTLLICFFYNEMLAITFDEGLAQASGINVRLINTVFVLLTAITVVLSMKVVGIMLISALLILPAVTALQIARSFRATMIVASVTSLFSVIFGIVFSFSWDLPTGAVIVMLNIIFFLMALLYKGYIMSRFD
ncbi:MAG: metal ABC transporter permease [Syntrophales bacterium]|nr:metal ABC transporter permease [Syntrophales bacterium]